MNILKLAAQLTLDGTRFKAGLKEAQVGADRFAAGVGRDIKSKLSGAFGAGAIAYGVKRLIDFNSGLVDTATKLDITTDSLQEQNFWLTQNGVDASALSGAYKGLSKARMAALEGDEGKLGQFGAMGVSKEELKSGSIEDLFKKVAEKFSNTDFGTDKIAVAMDMFGKAGMEMLPALNASLSEFAKKAHDAGQIINTEVSASLEEMGDALDRLGGVALPILSQVVVAVAKGLGNVLTVLDLFVGGMGAQLGRASVGKIEAPALGAKGLASKELVALSKSINADAAETAASATEDRWNKVLSKWESGGAEKKAKVKGTAYMTEPEEKASKEKAEKAAKEKQEIDRGEPGRANEVSSLTRTGQLSARDATQNAREPVEKLVAIAVQQLAVEKEQAASLKAMEKKGGQTINGHF